MPKQNDAHLLEGMNKRKSPEQIRQELDDSPFAGPAAEAAGATMVAVNEITPSPFQSRGSVDEQHIDALMQSIRESGLLVPIILRKVSTVDTSGEGEEKVSTVDTLELVAGHNRLEAFRRIGREHIPAVVKVLSDKDAARALTIENTHHKQLSDWELYKHLKMLRKAGAVKSDTDLAAVLGIARTHIYNLNAFDLIPAEVSRLLDQKPHLIGGKLAYALREYSVSHPNIVSEAINLVAQEKLKQAGVVNWVSRRADPPAIPYRKEVDIRGNGKSVRLVITDGEAKVSGDLNFDRLHALIEANLAELIAPPKDE